MQRCGGSLEEAKGSLRAGARKVEFSGAGERPVTWKKYNLQAGRGFIPPPTVRGWCRLGGTVRTFWKRQK